MNKIAYLVFKDLHSMPNDAKLMVLCAELKFAVIREGKLGLDHLGVPKSDWNLIKSAAYVVKAAQCLSNVLILECDKVPVLLAMACADQIVDVFWCNGRTTVDVCSDIVSVDHLLESAEHLMNECIETVGDIGDVITVGEQALYEFGAQSTKLVKQLKINLLADLKGVFRQAVSPA